MEALLAKVKSLFPEPFHNRLFLVGGMVRDFLLGIDCQDIDLAAALSPPELLKLGYRLVESKSTPTIYFRYHHQLGKIEITALPDVKALDEDLTRRDFTINAMAMNLAGEVLDPLHGKDDLEARLLRACTPQSLVDDPARIFRALRFECDGFRLAQETEALIAQRAWPELAHLPVERFSNEMMRSLEKPDPARFFKRLLELRVGESIIPELFRMPEVPAGPLQHHPEGDLFSHAVDVLERMTVATPNPLARFCGLFHDLGKLATSPDLYPKHHGHEHAGAQSAGPFCRRLRLPASYLKGLQGTCRLHGTANRWGELRESTRLKVAGDALKAGIADFLPLVVRADCKAEMVGWDEVRKVAAMNMEELGLGNGYFDDYEVPPHKRTELVIQRRVTVLRGLQGER